ncbi:stage 0 sporulation family protein [Ruminococcus sp. HUN007]|uniref:PSP1 domain-containing protein n=1 Tax=Ruminococcus sp. HUN007 TaxID=1514668 RepID=UPI0005D28AD9|nr:stage 0 sporulation family protein [Ruminococcus sp. HUN007]
MVEIVGIRFKKNGKIYYFAPGKIKAEAGQKAIVETVRGVECGEVVIPNRMLEDSAVTSELKEVIRIATPEDLEVVKKNKQKEKDAFAICQQKIKKRGLDMNLIDVEYTFDNNKILFYFTAETRVDFRELVKDLAAVFRTRIELRQIGVRDEAKILGGLGICGREFCCKGCIGEFQPVSIKMAKEQGLSLNPTKISGTCGRLMCCLKYEQNTYEELLKITPKTGAYVRMPNEVKGYVEEANIITGKLKVRPENDSAVPVIIDRSEVTIIKDSVIKVNKDEIKALKALEE